MLGRLQTISSKKNKIKKRHRISLVPFVCQVKSAIKNWSWRNQGSVHVLSHLLNFLRSWPFPVSTRKFFEHGKLNIQDCLVLYSKSRDQILKVDHFACWNSLCHIVSNVCGKYVTFPNWYFSSGFSLQAHLGHTGVCFLVLC